MENTAKSLDFPIPTTMKEDMRAHATFNEYRESLLAKIRNREPGIRFNPSENVMPELYIDYPLQAVPLDKIDDLPPQAVVSKRGLESFAKSGIEPGKGAFHGARLGRHVDIPIALTINSDGTLSIIDGMHRAAQAFISEDKAILAFVESGTGPTLEEIYNIARAE